MDSPESLETRASEATDRPDRPLAQPLGRSVGQSRRSLRRKIADLHGGQLVMLLVVYVLIAPIVFLIGVELYSQATGARESLAKGDYVEAPQIVTVAGETFRLKQAVSRERVNQFRTVGDSLVRAGVPLTTIERFIDETGEMERAYVRSRVGLDADASRLPIGLTLMFAGVGTLVFGFWSLWVWLGARSRAARRGAL